MVVDGKKNKTRNEKKLKLIFAAVSLPFGHSYLQVHFLYQAKMSILVDTVSDVVEMYVKVKVARMVGEMDLVQKNT